MVEKWFEFTMGELFEEPIYTALWQLKDDVDFDKVYLKLGIAMMEFIKLESAQKENNVQ